MRSVAKGMVLSKFDELKQVLPETAEVNSRGHLVIGGCDLVELAQEFGTPLFVYCEETIRNHCRDYREAFHSLAPDTVIIYAGKAFISVAMCQLIAGEGLALDVSSGGELFTALEAGFPPDRMYQHGNNKSRAELEEAVNVGVGRVVVDSFDELKLLDAVAGDAGKTVPILLRITPGIKAETHRFLQTATLDSKFGFPLAQDIAVEAVRASLALKNIELRGFHTHIGSQLFSLEPYNKAVKVMLDFVSMVKSSTGYPPDIDDDSPPFELNMGGGLGVMYQPSDKPPSISDYARAVAGEILKQGDRLGLGKIRIMVEPGRSIAGRAGVTLYQVGTVKDIPEHLPYISVDGGMSDNLRPLLYGAEYSALLANKAAQSPEKAFNIAGKHCETGDILIRDCALPPVAPGDFLATATTGAYGYSMANSYNKLTRPAVVLASAGRGRLIVRRETYQDLVDLDLPLT